MPQAVLALLAALPARTLRACPACFSAVDNQNLSRAYTWGVFILMGLTFLILTILALTVRRIESGRARSGLGE